MGIWDTVIIKWPFTYHVQVHPIVMKCHVDRLLENTRVREFQKCHATCSRLGQKMGQVSWDMISPQVYQHLQIQFPGLGPPGLLCIIPMRFLNLLGLDCSIPFWNKVFFASLPKWISRSTTIFTYHQSQYNCPFSQAVSILQLFGLKQNNQKLNIQKPTVILK